VRTTILTGLVVATFIAASATEVTTNALKVLPERTMRARNLDAWEAEVLVDQGQLMKWGQNMYWAVDGGMTGSEAPVFTSGSETNGTTTLAYIQPGPRRGFVIQLEEEGVVWLRAYQAPTEHEHITLTGDLAHWAESGDGVPQGAIWAKATVGTNNLAATEW